MRLNDLFSSHSCFDAPIPQTKPAAKPATGAPPRFEIKKWNAVAMWSWDICADTVWLLCSRQCTSHLYESAWTRAGLINCLFSVNSALSAVTLSMSHLSNIKQIHRPRMIMDCQLHSGTAGMFSILIASSGGSKREASVLCVTRSGTLPRLNAFLATANWVSEYGY